MFWRFGGYANISSIDNILDRGDVTLEDLLDENDVIQELKAQNAKLIEFLREDAALEKLLKYVIAPKVPNSSATPSPEAEIPSRPGFFGKSRSKARSSSRENQDDPDQLEAKRAKYAFVACEILSSEVWSISESLIESTDHLRDFWEYIKSKHPLDNRTATYFSKVNETLLEKKPPEMVAFIKSLDGVVANLMKHVDCPVIMDLLLKLISLEKDPATQGIVNWLQSQDLIPIFLSYITPEHPSSIQTSAGDFLKAIITISANATGQDASVIGPNELTRQLVSEECISSLLTEMLKGGNPLTVGVGIIIEVIRKNNSDYDTEGQVGLEPKSSDPIYLGNLLRLFANNVPRFMELIMSKTHTVVADGVSKTIARKDLEVAWGGKIEPLGFDRFKTCELMAELLHCSNMGLLNEKGSEAEIRRRDAEREKLKADGTLAAARSSDLSSDSSMFSHSQSFVPLDAPSAEPRTLEVHNAIEEDEDEFEQVNASEATPELPDRPTSQPPSSTEPATETQPGTTSENAQDASVPNTTSTNAIDLGDPIPAPLFSKKSPAKDASIDSEEASHHAEPNSEPETSATPPVTDANEHSESQLPLGGDQSERQQQPDIQREEDGAPVVGDLLKIMFVEHHVVPNILDFFFRFPWNNFLHNVVYDVVQQVFNGSMDRGYNRNLAIDLFQTGRITKRVIEGQKRSEKSQQERKMRLGYMGHLTLIAEEIVKFTERQPTELLAQAVVDKIMDPDWIHYVEFTLTETRDRDNAILGGVRPDHALGPRQTVLNSINATQGGFGGSASSALANAGLTGTGSSGLESLDLTTAGAAGYGLNTNASASLLSGFGGSDDEEEEEEDDEDELDDGEIGADSSQDFQQRRTIDDDNDQASQPTTTTLQPQQPTSDPPPIPAPLAIPPSRARLQLQARLKERERLAATGNTSSDTANSNNPNIPPSSLGNAFEIDLPITTASGSSKSTPTNPESSLFTPGVGSDNDDFPDVESSGDESVGNGFGDDFTGFIGTSSENTEGEREVTTEEEDDDDDDDDDSGDDNNSPPTGAGVRRQTTREALVREPLDGDDDSDEDEEEESAMTISPYTLPSAAQQQEGPSSPTQTSRRMSADAAAEAKKREQDRLLRRWGFDEEHVSTTTTASSSRGGGSGPSSPRASRMVAAPPPPPPPEDDDEEDDSDDDGGPVVIGNRYLARHRTGSS